MAVDFDDPGDSGIADDAACQLRRLIQAAAHAAGCTTAMFLEDFEGGWRPIHSFGIASDVDSVAIYERVAVTAAAAPSWESRRDRSEAIRLDGGRCFALVAGAPVHCGGRPRGQLVVGSYDSHDGLTKAQIYVLRTHAVVIGQLLTLRELRQHDLPRAEANTERLRLLESVAVHANDAILITEAEPIDAPGPRILYCNAAFTRTTGYAESEVIGRTPRLLQGVKSDRATLNRLRRHLATWQPVVVELINYRKDGSEFLVELSIVPVADQSGWFTYWVSVQRDISDRRTVEEAAMRARLAEVEKQALEAEIHGRKLVEARLFHAAFHDDLTKLHNRAFFMQQLSATLGQIRRRQLAGAALLFLDLNRFKLVNDTLGHGVGDRLLVEVAHRLSQCVRPSDVLARMGGDEFAILVDTADGSQAALTVAARIVELLPSSLQLGGHALQCSCSIGVVELTPAYREPEELLRDADIAMYRAKKTGVCAYAVFTDAADAEAVLALELQTEMQPALDQQQFRLQYQPIFSATERRVVAFEALIRWQHPRRGLLQPGTFIATAEAAGLIRPIGRWVLRQAARQARAWQQRNPTVAFKMNVNLSARELQDEAFVAAMLDTLDAAGLAPDAIEFEITETVFLDRSRPVLHVLENLRALGVRLALDDFGTGYSSLGYLDSYPIDTLKIDRSFVGGMLEQRRPRAIVEAIIRLAESLDLDTVAEGVETQAQAEMLTAMGCRNLQGFHLSRPIDADAAARLLSQAPFTNAC